MYTLYFTLLLAFLLFLFSDGFAFSQEENGVLTQVLEIIFSDEQFL